MTNRPSLLVFTDLDGTLLDHHTYDWRPAREALTLAAAKGIPVIFNTSKTLAESLVIQRELELEHPMVFENGAGVALPATQWPRPKGVLVETGKEHWVVPLSKPYTDVRDTLQQLRSDQGYRFIGFGDMTVEQVREFTGLSREAAQRARQRDFGEPLVWRDSAARLNRFIHDLQAAGLQVLRGGRFLHVGGPTDKGKAMLWLARRYGEPPPVLAALGDSENDIAMLAGADIAVWVRSPVKQVPAFVQGLSPRRCLVTEREGPEGWNQAVIGIIEEHVNG